MATDKKARLEDAIRRTSVQVDISETAITLERKKLAEGASSYPIASYAQKRMYNDDHDLGYDAKYWKRQCENLLEDRIVVENQLRQKLETVLKEQNQLRDHADTLMKEDRQLRKDATILRAFNVLTGMDIGCVDGNEFTCTLKNAVDRKGTVFSVTLDATDNTVTARPRANISLLPSYLQENEICCDASMAPVILRDAMLQVFEGLQGDSTDETDEI